MTPRSRHNFVAVSHDTPDHAAAWPIGAPAQRRSKNSSSASNEIHFGITTPLQSQVLLRPMDFADDCNALTCENTTFPTRWGAAGTHVLPG
jgi:hypothetical protein